MMKSHEKSQKEGLMTRKLLLTTAIFALALAPSIGGSGTAQAHGFYGGGYGRGFYGGYGRGFYGGYGRGFYRGYGGRFYGGYGGFYPGYNRYSYFPYCYYCY
jgi:hypothetical protein